MTRVLALAKYGREAASTRQRLLQFLPALEAAGFTVDVEPLLDDSYVRALAKGSGYSRARLLAAYSGRFRTLRRARDYQLLWVYAELFPCLPAGFERLAFASGKPVIYDFDDAFFHGHDRRFWLRDKLEPLIAGAAAVTAGNEYLGGYARRWSAEVHVVPTVVDTSAYVPAPHCPDRPVTIGWIGSPSTWAYVRPYLPLIADTCGYGRARFLAVGAGRAAEADRFEGMDLREWSEATETADVQEMDIGIMPLPDEPWARGKCGYKLIQYMACGLPVVASPVGVNCSIVGNETSGLLASTTEQWRNALGHLIADRALRARFGAEGRQRVVRDYSLQSQAPRVIALFKNAVGT